MNKKILFLFLIVISIAGIPEWLNIKNKSIYGGSIAVKMGNNYMVVNREMPSEITEQITGEIPSAYIWALDLENSVLGCSSPCYGQMKISFKCFDKIHQDFVENEKCAGNNPTRYEDCHNPDICISFDNSCITGGNCNECALTKTDKNISNTMGNAYYAERIQISSFDLMNQNRGYSFWNAYWGNYKCGIKDISFTTPTMMQGCIDTNTSCKYYDGGKYNGNQITRNYPYQEEHILCRCCGDNC